MAMNLRDLQEVIERREFDTHPVRQWNRRPDSGGYFYYCDDDGTIYEKPEDYCPNPYHPHLPPRTPNRGLLLLVLISVCLALIYSIITNETLVTLIVTFLLIVISFTVFAALFLAFTYLNLTLAPSPETRERNRRFLGFFSSIISAVFAMIIVSLLQGQFPSLDWWIIEFGIAYLLESFVADPLTLWVYSRRVWRDEAPGRRARDPFNRDIIQLYKSSVIFSFRQRAIFFATSLTVGIWSFHEILFGVQPHLVVILTAYGLAILWSFIFFLNHFAALEDPRLNRVYRDRFLHVQCLYAALKPAESEHEAHPWVLPLFYVSLIISVGGYVIGLLNSFHSSGIAI